MDIGYFVEVEIKYPYETEEKTKNFLFRPENKNIPQDEISEFLNDVKPNRYTQNRKLICDWTEKIFLIQYRILKLYGIHGMKVDKVLETISFRQNK